MIKSKYETYRGITKKEYLACMQEYSNKMFKLFDTSREYNSNRGNSLMWLGSWTANCIACDVINKHLDEKITLFEALIECLKIECKERANDLELIKNI